MDKVVLDKPERNVFWTATILCCASIIAGFLSGEALFFLAPPAFLFAYQMIINFKVIFFVLLIATPFSIEYYAPSGFSTTLPTEPIMIIFMLTFLFFIFLKRDLFDRQFLLHPISVVLYIHFTWILITTIFSADIVISLKYVLSKTWYVVSWYFIAALVIKDLDSFKKAFWCLFIPTFFLTIYTIYNHWTYQFRFAEVNRTMVPFFRNHVNYAVFLALMTPLTFTVAHWYERHSWQRIMLNIGKFLLLAGIYFSYTRSSWISVAGAFAAYFIIRNNKLMWAASLAVIGVIFFAWYMLHDNKYLDYAPDYKKTIYHSNFTDHMESTLTLEDVSSAERIYRWVGAVHMIHARPVTGFGPGSFYFNYKRYTINKFETYISRNDEHSTVHNYYLQVTSEQGFPGIAIWATLLLFVLYYAQMLYTKLTNKRYKGLVMAIALSFITILINISLSDLIEADKIGTSFFFFIALLVQVDLLRKRYPDLPESIPQI
ncbi:MAG: O-antigen ligase family protein [Chitinophagales bacterium]